MSTGLTTTTTAIILLMVAINEGGGADGRFWISKAKPIARELLDVQALVVKDEEVAVGCKATTTTHNDVRYSNKRYLMCAGSILTSRYILTSASCIHEATHIRHNIRAPLAVMIGSFSDTAQVIKIASYSVHPGHLVDPRDKNHALHNVAVAKLVCRIRKSNLHKIQLPTQPFADECAESNCQVTITQEIGPMSFVMDEVPAQDIMVDIGDVRKKRELLAASKMKSRNDTVDETIRFNSRDIKKVRKSNENGADNARIIETGERTNNENPKFINENILKNRTNSISLKRSLISHHAANRKLVTRESRGIKGCPQTGSAVMSNTIQAAMVTISCDDRQPDTPWQYTDLFDNLDWINEMIGNWKPSPTLSGCTTCIYNFFIDYNCKNRAQCQKNLQSGSHPVQSVNCSGNPTDLKNPASRYHSRSYNDSESMNRAYIEAIYKLYVDKHDHANDNVFERTSEKNSYGSFVETAVKPRLFFKSASLDFNVASEKTRVPDYTDNRADLDSNYRRVKATYDNDYKPVGNVADGNEHPERKNRDYKPRYNRINKLDVATTSVGKSVENLEGLFADDNGKQVAIAKKFAVLYAMFLEEQKKSREKISKNVVRRAR